MRTIDAQVISLTRKLWDYLCLDNKIEKCDCILGLGSHDLHVAERCAELYHQGYSDIIIFSGGLGKVTKDIWNAPEADKFAEIAIKLGVPKEKILIESKSTNSGENFRFTRDLIEKNNLDINSFLLVHKPYMERRAFATFSVVMSDKKCVVTSPTLSFDEYFDEYKDGPVSREEMINVIVGDLQRIRVYPENGWQIKQAIPDDVWDAYEKLVAFGYDKYVINS